MKNTFKNVFLTCLFSFCLTQINNITGQETIQVIIIKESTDQEGNKEIEKIVKKNMTDKEIEELLEESGDVSRSKINRLLNDDNSFFYMLEPEIGSRIQRALPGDLFDNNQFFNADKPTIGVYLEAKEGEMVVSSVMKSLGAEEAGIQEGDIIKSINGRKISNIEDIEEALEGMDTGKVVEIQIDRGENSLLKKVELRENGIAGLRSAPSPRWENQRPFFQEDWPMLSMNRPKMGIQIENGGEGVLITDVTANSPADKAGLKEGDIIIT